MTNAFDSAFDIKQDVPNLESAAETRSNPMEEILSTGIFLAMCSWLSYILSQPSRLSSVATRAKGIISQPIYWFLAILIIWLSTFFFMPALYPPDESIGTGEAGDMFGALTSLFSGFAFSGLIWTLTLQQKELSLQRDEIRQTRNVFERQAFETTFFNMLKTLNEHVASLKNSHSEGRDLISQWSNSLDRRIKIARGIAKCDLKDVQNEFSIAKAIYHEYFREELEPQMGPYYRILYNIFKFVKEANLSDDPNKNWEEQKRYAAIARAQLSSSEVKFLLFNGTSKFGEKFKDLIERYNLLKHLSEDDEARYPYIYSRYRTPSKDA